MADRYTHLRVEERAMMQMHLSMGVGPAKIAFYLGRARSTITRELIRNGWQRPRLVPRSGRKLVAGGYDCGKADRRAQQLAAVPRVAGKLIAGTPLWALMVEHLRRGLSPAQIERTLARMPDPVQLSRETIYTALYAMPKGQLRASLLELMRRRHKTKRSQQGKNKSNHGSIPDMTLIDLRPIEVQMRLIPGHWEGDLIIGKNNLSAIGTLVERTTGYTMLVHLPDGYKAEQVRDALTEKIKTIPDILRASLTWDQGAEMGAWKEVSVAADIDIYFCDPHAPWQRGTNENTNGLLRQYYPKGTDLSIHSAIDLDWVATELNDRPRKRLGFAKPIEEIGPLLLR
jgi:IS30 family transposase